MSGVSEIRSEPTEARTFTSFSARAPRPKWQPDTAPDGGLDKAEGKPKFDKPKFDKPKGAKGKPAGKPKAKYAAKGKPAGKGKPHRGQGK